MSISASAGRIKAGPVAAGAAFPIIMALSFSHLLNDMMQSLVPALYPMLKGSYGLSFAQIGVIALTMQATSSLLQPAIGLSTDRRPQPYSLAIGMAVTLVGLLLLAHTADYQSLLLAAAMVGIGSAVFHPEASRVARMASGGRYGLAQSVFQVGGNAGSALGPLLAAVIVIPRGQGSIAWFSLSAWFAMAMLFSVGNWYRRERSVPPRHPPPPRADGPHLSRGTIGRALVILLLLIFSTSFYTTSLNTYYTFYLISRFQLSLARAQTYLFVFLAAVAVGTLIGGPLSDRVGRKSVMWVSILGVLPFTLLLPHANLFWTGVLTVVIGLTLASASSTIIVYALDLVPGRIGTIAGLFFGLFFGLAGVGAALLGRFADATGIDFVYQVCAFLPAIGVLTALVPNLGRPMAPTR
jgi:FSR family fosmidomycin resistance protein-like MFS transporter